MTVTLRDIAQRAAVSTSTVSRALNGYPFVGATTRSAVWQAAQELGYSFSNLRRAAQTNHRLVLLLARVQSFKSEQSMSLTGIERMMSIGAESVLREHGIAVRVQRSHMEPQEVEVYADEAGIAGLILLGGMLNRDFVHALQGLRIPFVVAGAHLYPLQVNCVRAEYAHGMEQVVTYLVMQGRRRIGFVNGPEATTSSEEKFKGFRLVLSMHGLPFKSEQVVAADFSSESGYEQTHQLLQQAPDVDAIAYGDDIMAMGGLHALKESGRGVPQDVAVTGFYNYELARFTDPPLTSVHFDMQSMGAIAARRLKMLLEENNDQAWTISVPTSLVVRKSV